MRPLPTQTGPTAAGLLAAVFLCAGCYSYRPLVVHVRDGASGETVQGATVIADALDPRHPLRVSDLLNPFSPSGAEGVTDSSGRATVRCVVDQPVQFRVLAPGHEPRGLYFDRAPDSTDWLAPGLEGDGPLGTLSVRFGPLAPPKR